MENTPSQGAPHKKKIGDLLAEVGLISQEQLEIALNHQAQLKATGKSPLLGRILIDLRFITSKQLLSVTRKNSILLPLGEILLIEEKITDEQLAQAIQYKNTHPEKKLGDILLYDLKLIDHETFLRSLAKQYNLNRIKPKDGDLDPDLLYLFAKGALTEQKYLPYQIFINDEGEQSMIILISEKDIGNREILHKISMAAKTTFFAQNRKDGKKKERPSELTIDFALAYEKEILDFIEYAFNNKDAISLSRSLVLDQDNDDGILQLSKKFTYDNTNLNIFTRILMSAVDQRTSDIHIDPTKDNIRIRFRIDGVLIEQTSLPKALRTYFVRGIKNYFRFKNALYATFIDDRISARYVDINMDVDIRVSIMPIIYGERMVMRLLYQTADVPTFEQLGMSRNTQAKYKYICSMASGIVIVTGPTGSGKTTTLFSTLDYVNNDDISILTLEDPPEYLLDGVAQCDVKASSKQGSEPSFTEALKTALRQDPDIIMFGEMRDAESASVALTAGLTGHMLFTTLHTNDAASAITRLFDLGIRPFLLSSTIVSILAQRLVRKTCPNCREPYTPNTYDLDFFRGIIANIDYDIENKVIHFTRGKGCEECNYIGYKRRVAIHELLYVNDEIRLCVLEGGTARDAERIAREYGMTSLLEDGFVKAVKGVTTIEEVLRVAKSLEKPRLMRSYAQIEELLYGNIDAVNQNQHKT